MVQNSAMGAFFLWLFCRYYQQYKDGPPSITLAFLILPLILHKATVTLICSTQKSSGIHLFSGKIGKQKEALLAIHARALQLRPLTLESLGMAEAAGLIEIEARTAKLIFKNIQSEFTTSLLPDELKKLTTCCDKLAYWFSESSEQQIAKTLMVDF
nr:three component ABC system middle component [Serratia quinivorans]